MKRPVGPTPWHATLGHRLASGAFGALLSGVGLYLPFETWPPDALQLLGVAVMLVLGGNLVWCAITGRASWMSRVGPLP